MLFYLILRALDTIEDDMTIPYSQKVEYLKEFPDDVTKPGWTFDKCMIYLLPLLANLLAGPNEKDRHLLQQFDVVIEEFLAIKPVYRSIIVDKTRRMADGMAEYCGDQDKFIGIKTSQDYNQYCYYVGGLVGLGLTDLFVESGLGNPGLKERPWLHRSMGLFLQKTNIIRDIREDFDDKRLFWPEEVWKKYVDSFDMLLEPQNSSIALRCSSEMVADALEHASDCIMYLAGLREQSVFNFCAIPQVMAMATLHLVFRNPATFQRNVKITKGEACAVCIFSEASNVS